MITIFLRTAWRAILRNRFHSALNILGFSTGLACFGLITIWLIQQLSFDNIHKNADRIYQVNASVENESSAWKEAVSPAPLGLAMRDELSEVENVLRIDVSDAVVQGSKEQFKEDWILAADPSFFTFFNFKLLKGNAALALSRPYSIVISESMAKKYFGDVDPINQSLRLFAYDPDGKGADYLVTGIIEDCPATSHFNYTMIISFSTIEKAEPETLTARGWSNHEYYNYVMLKNAGAAPGILEKLPPLTARHVASSEEKDHYQYFLTPLREIHFQSEIRGEMQPGVSKTYLLSFGAIAFVVLLFACINYVNLSTAFAVDRYKDVGIRKILGSSHKILVIQYLAQSWLMAMVAMVVALGWMEMTKPLFEVILGSQLNSIYTFEVMFALFSIASVAGILSGIYPALLIASVQPIRILKGYFSKGSSGMMVRKVLVVVQYSVTVLLLIAVITVSAQLKFINDKDLGFNTENVLVVAMNGSPEAMAGFSSFYDQLKSVGSITGVTRSNTSIGGGLSKEAAEAESHDGKRVDLHVNTAGIDHDYLNTYGIELVAGRNFIPGSASDSSRFIINEATAHALGFIASAEVIGKHFRIGDRDGDVVAVVKDFHHASLHARIEPLALYLLPNYYSRISIRMTGDQLHNMQQIERAWKKSFPSTVFDYAFADDKLQNSYRQEDRFAKLYLVFSTISIVIASLGLFALISYTVERRTKEIGIRKVLGANVLQISTLLSKEFMVLVIISCGISMPLGWYATNEWLQSFAYHINPGVTVIIGSGILTVILALTTLCLRTVNSALANPVTSLRQE
jgi:putative ABC transport system permease protein